jgi:hypothetical protein
MLDEAGRSELGIRFLPARYSYRQLEAWHMALWPYYGTDVAMHGVDDRHNRLLVGATTEGARARVTAALPHLGIPTDAVRFELVTPARTTAQRHLQNQVRPLVGGLRIHVGRPSGGYETGSMGPNVLWNKTRYAIVSSHVADATFNGATNRVVYQASQGGSGRIGVVTANPRYVSSSQCPAPDRCRFSDAALVRIDGGVSTRTAEVAAPIGGPATGWGNPSALMFEDTQNTLIRDDWARAPPSSRASTIRSLWGTWSARWGAQRAGPRVSCSPSWTCRPVPDRG